MTNNKEIKVSKEQIYQLIHDAEIQLKINNRIQVKILLNEIHNAVKQLENDK